MRVLSGDITKYLYFVAVDENDLKTREPGFSSFTVVRSRNGAADSAMTTPTVTEIDATNMPGVYALLMDEDMTLADGNVEEEMVFHITHAGMAPVTRTVNIYDDGSIIVTVNTVNSTAVAFETDAAEGTDEHYRGRWLLGLSGALKGQKLPVIGYENTNGTFRVLNHTTDIPSNGDTFRLLP